jgi:hypothetical protein
MTDFLQTTHRTVGWLKKTLDEERLHMKPPYQRNPVWLTPQKSSLIDTILRGYPVPELYMEDVVDAEGQEEHFVVDGQQRIRACIEFVDGEFELEADESENWGEMAFDDLSDPEKKRIWGYKFVVRLVPEVPEEEIREVFRRINRYNMALNKQELRHATYWGGFLTKMEELAGHPFWPTSGLFTANDVRRMLDVEFISELAIAVIHGPQNKKASLDRWYRAYEEEFPEESAIDEVFDDVLGELGKLLPDMRSTRWRRASDFYTLFTVLASHHDDLPLSADGRAEARRQLLRFGEHVSSYLADDSFRTSQRVRKYANAVQRAASDLGSRRTRSAQLEAALRRIW